MQDVTIGETQWKVHGEFKLSLQLTANLYLIISKSKSKKKKERKSSKVRTVVLKEKFLRIK